jgi:hypothetical protein
LFIKNKYKKSITSVTDGICTGINDILATCRILNTKGINMPIVRTLFIFKLSFLYIKIILKYTKTKGKRPEL